MGKINGTIGFLDLENIDIDIKIVALSALLTKLWPKMSFCKIVANITRSRTLHIQITQVFFNLLKSSNPSYPVLKLSDNCPSSNQDMAQSVILQVHDLKSQGHP